MISGKCEYFGEEAKSLWICVNSWNAELHLNNNNNNKESGLMVRACKSSI